MLQRLVLTAFFVATLPKLAFAAGATNGAQPSSVSRDSVAATGTASSTASKDATLKAPLSNTKNKKSKPSSLSLGLTAGQEGYISRSSSETGTNAYSEIGARLKYQTAPNSNLERHTFGAKINIGGTTSASVENYTNFEVPEAYASITSLDLTRPDADPGQLFSEVNLGRKKERWSGVDSDWSLGLAQPFNKFDGLRPSEQGLTGAFAKFGAGGVQVTAFGSPLFIPEQGAPYQVEDGKFSTTSPWFSAPPDTLILSLGSSPVRSPVNYSLDIPAISSVVTNASFGGMVRVSDPDSSEGFFAQASYLRKPQNALSLAFNGKLTLSDSTTYGDVHIFPEVVYHSLAGIDLGYEAEAFTFSVSGLYEKPDQPTASSELTSQQLSPMSVFSPSVELRPFAATMFAPKVRFSYLNTEGGEVTTVGKFAANGNVFGPRTMYRRAFSAGLNTTLYRSQRFHLEAGTRWIEELEEQGSIVMTDLRLGIGSAWALTLQGDVLGSRKPTSSTDTFIARYRANDRVAGRITYIF
jgi:hypothetical protein